MTRLLCLVFALAAGAARATYATPLLDVPALGALATTRLDGPNLDPPFLAKVAKTAEETLGLIGAAHAGVGPMSAASMKLPGNRGVAFVFGYIKGGTAKHPRRWFTAFTSRGKCLAPIEVNPKGTEDLPAFQSIDPRGVFWFVLKPGPNGRLLHFDVVTELTERPIVAGNFDPSPSSTNYLSYTVDGGQELLIYRISDKFPKAVPGAMAINPTVLQANDVTVNALLGNFDTVQKNLTKIRPVVYVTK